MSRQEYRENKKQVDMIMDNIIEFIHSKDRAVKASEIYDFISLKYDVKRPRLWAMLDRIYGESKPLLKVSTGFYVINKHSEDAERVIDQYKWKQSEEYFRGRVSKGIVIDFEEDVQELVSKYKLRFSKEKDFTSKEEIIRFDIILNRLQS